MEARAVEENTEFVKRKRIDCGKMIYKDKGNGVTKIGMLNRKEANRKRNRNRNNDKDRERNSNRGMRGRCYTFGKSSMNVFILGQCT